MEWWSWVGVWDVHIGQGEAVEQAPIIVADLQVSAPGCLLRRRDAYIVKNDALTLVKADSKGPLLPFDQFSRLSCLRRREARTLRLYHIQGLQVRPQVLMFWDVFVRCHDFVRFGLLDAVVGTGREHINTNDSVFFGIYYGRYSQRESVVVGIGFRGVRGMSHVQETLEHPLIIVDTIRSYQSQLQYSIRVWPRELRTIDPRVNDNHRSFRKLQLRYLRLYPFIRQCNFLDEKYLLSISRTVDIRAQSYMAFDFVLGEVYDGFVEFVLSMSLLASILAGQCQT